MKDWRHFLRTISRNSPRRNRISKIMHDNSKLCVCTSVFRHHLFFLISFLFCCCLSDLCRFSSSCEAEIRCAAIGGLCLQRGSQRSEEQTIAARGPWHESLSRWLKWAGVAAGSGAQFKKSCQSSSAYGSVIDYCCVLDGTHTGILIPWRGLHGAALFIQICWVKRQWKQATRAEMKQRLHVCCHSEGRRTLISYICWYLC